MRKITKVPLEVISIEGDGFHLMTHISMNNIPATMLIDTGASKSVLDKGRIHKFVEHSDFEINEQLSTGLGTNTMESHNTIMNEIKIGELVISDYKAILIDLSHVNESYERIGLSPIDGVLGSDILNKYNAVIDYEKQILKLKYNI